MITIGGENYKVRFDMAAWRIMEEEHGVSLGELGSRLREAETASKTIVVLLSALVRSGGSLPAETTDVELLQRLGMVQPDEYFAAVVQANQAVRKGLMSKKAKQPDDVAFDPLLAQLDRAHGEDHSLTYRQAVAYGLIAGMTYTEIQAQEPGFVIDQFLYRQEYDDAQHQIKRNQSTEAPIDEGINWEE